MKESQEFISFFQKMSQQERDTFWIYIQTKSWLAKNNGTPFHGMMRKDWNNVLKWSITYGIMV